jgi:hypothetical protein
MIAACTTGERPGDESSPGAGVPETDNPDTDDGDGTTTQDQQACADAIAQTQSCMSLQAFLDLEVQLLAYRQTTDGPCGACHDATESCPWLSYSEQEMFSTWTDACMGERLFTCRFDEAGELIDLEPAGFLDVVEYGDGSNHPQGAVGSQSDDVTQFLEDAIQGWRDGGCG